LTFGQINTSSGAFTSISQLPNGLALPSDVTASNPITGEYYFRANPSVNSSNTIAVSESTGAYRYLNNGSTLLGFDVADNLIVASAVDLSGNHLVMINPITQVQTQLPGTYAPASQFFTSAGTAVNSIGREVYLETSTSLLVVNLDTGALVRSVPLSQNMAGMLAWDPVSGTLYDFTNPALYDFRLASINTSTGQVNVISTSNVVSGGVYNQGRSLSVIDGVVYVHSDNGTYGINNIYDVVDLATGKLKGTFASSAITLFPQDQVVLGGSSNTVFPFAVQNENAAIIKVGTGTTVLTGQNQNGAGTVVMGGVLQLGNGGTTGSVTANVVNNGSLVFDRSDAFSFGGAISGSGSVSQIGSGTVVLTGANTYTGGTTISAGTLQLGTPTTNGSITGNVLNNGKLQFDRSDTYVFAGNISGSGVVWVGGQGTAILTGSSTYTGDTSVFINANLQAGNGGTTGSFANAPIHVGGGTITFNRSDTYVFSGSITDAVDGTGLTGKVNQVGTGTTVLAGINTYSGSTSVSSGILSVTGSIARSSVSVASGATLNGGGTVGATVIQNGGTLAPGNSIGTLTVNGNLTLASAAMYDVEVSSTAADRTTVTGSANIDGTVIASVASGAYNFGQRFTILTATGGVTGTFARLNGVPYYLKGQFSYDANNAYLTISPNALTPLLSNPTGNQKNAVSVIDAAVAAGAVPAGGFSALYSLSGLALSSAIDQISGQLGPNIANGVGQASLSFLSLTSQGGDGGASFTPGGAYGAAGAPHRAQLASGEMRVWGAAFGGHVGLSADPVSGAASLSGTNTGLVGGLDKRLTDNFLVGATLGLGRQNFRSGNGTGESDDVTIGIYARHESGPLYVSAALGYGWHHVTTLRVVTVSGTDVLQGKQDATDVGGRIEAGYRLSLDQAYDITPYAAFLGDSLDSPAFAETAVSGASTFALSYAGRTSTLGRTEAGAKLSRDYALEDGALAAGIRAAWAHQIDDVPLAQATFLGLPGAGFVVAGVRPARDTALLGASLEMHRSSGLFFGVKGETQLGAGTTIVEGMGTLGWRW
jgi:autotransporter-associated beta strand protein